MEFKWHSEPIMWKEMVDSNGKKTGKMDGMNSISLWNHSCFRSINKPKKEVVKPQKEVVATVVKKVKLKKSEEVVKPNKEGVAISKKMEVKEASIKKTQDSKAKARDN